MDSAWWNEIDVIRNRCNRVALRAVEKGQDPQRLFQSALSVYAKTLKRLHVYELEGEADESVSDEFYGILSAALDLSTSAYLGVQPESSRVQVQLFRKLCKFEVSEVNAARFVVEVAGFRKAAGIERQRPLLGKLNHEEQWMEPAREWIAGRVAPLPVRPDIPDGDLDNVFWRKRVADVARAEGIQDPDSFPEAVLWARSMAAETSLPLSKSQSSEIAQNVLGSSGLEL